MGTQQQWPDRYVSPATGRDWESLARQGGRSGGLIEKTGRAARKTVKWVLIAGIAALALVVTGIGLVLVEIDHHVSVSNGHQEIQRKQCSDYKEKDVTYMFAQASLFNGSTAGYVSYGDGVWHPVTVGGMEQMNKTVNLPDSATDIQC